MTTPASTRGVLRKFENDGCLVLVLTALVSASFYLNTATVNAIQRKAFLTFEETWPNWQSRDNAMTKSVLDMDEQTIIETIELSSSNASSIVQPIVATPTVTSSATKPASRVDKPGANETGTAASATSSRTAFIHGEDEAMANEAAAITSTNFSFGNSEAMPNPRSGIAGRPLKLFSEDSIVRFNTITYVWRSHPFWNNGMQLLCDRIADAASSKANTPLLVNFTAPCSNPMKTFGLGTGNIILALYGLRLASAVMGAQFEFRCSDLNNVQAGVDATPFSEEILPWLQGSFSHSEWRDTEFSTSPYLPAIPPKELACQGMGKCPLYYMSHAIRQDLRRMAITLVGSQQGSEHVPLLSNVTIDDVAIHFRCGDAIAVRSTSYGFVKFDAYKTRISPNAQSIGIITQSFDPKYNRKRDQGFTELCQILVSALKNYLESAFPHAKVTIRNGPHETLALAYARLILANQTFTGPTTFGIFPAIASFGKGYIQEGRLSYFVPPITQVYKDVEMMAGPMLDSKRISKMKTLGDILEWLQEPSQE